MGKRASLPGASELFRATDQQHTHDMAPTPSPQQTAPNEPNEWPTPSGRVKHDHKITVYFSEEELLALEDANLALRRNHGVRVDRGRLVRAAVALALRDLYEGQEESSLVQELRG